MAKKRKDSSFQKKSRKKAQLFSPDELSTAIHQALSADLTEGSHEYAFQARRTPARAKAAEIQLEHFLKKYEREDVDKEKLENEAFLSFVRVNEYLKRVDRKTNFPYGIKRDSSKLAYRHRVLLKARALVRSVLPPLDEERWFEKCKHSTGSTSGVSFLDTSFTRKMKPPISVTAEARYLFDRYLQWDFQLKEVLQFSGVNFDDWMVVVEGPAATTVPKTSEKRRQICPMPTANMFLQLGLMELLYEVLAGNGLDVTYLPDIHRDLAKLYSVSRECGTLDWSDASNSVGIELVRWLLPPDWFDVLNRLREKVVFLRGRPFELSCFSTMGNACTFPIELLVFWAMAHAVASVERGEHSLFLNPEVEPRISVFGDDCIVPYTICVPYIQVMEGLGFTLNWDKSHYAECDHFRESCGGDFLNGEDVRPFHLKAPDSQKVSQLAPWLYKIVNSLQRKYILYFGENTACYDREVFKAIFRLFRRYRQRILLVPPHFPDDAGLHDLGNTKILLSGFEDLLGKIRTNGAGWTVFNFQRFIYRKVADTNPRVLLYQSLRTPRDSHPLAYLQAEKPKVKPFVRRKGSYVVARGISTSWVLTAG
jgi:hypothetical protein